MTTPTDDARQLPHTIAGQIIDRWHEALSERQAAYFLAGDSPDDIEAWTDLTTQAWIDAHRLLIHAILSFDPEYVSARRHKVEKRRWEPRGLRSRGKLYIAFPNPDRDEGREGIPEDLDGPDLMMVVVVDEANIVDVS